MRDGYTILETCKKLEELGADVVGLNCFRGPATMLPYIKERKPYEENLGKAIQDFYKYYEKLNKDKV